MMNNLNTFNNILKYAKDNNLMLHEICQNIEAKNQEISVDAIRTKTEKILDVMKQTIQNGLSSSELSMSKMTGNDCKKLQTCLKNKTTFLTKEQENLMLYALATAEENARMGKIAACPTAGACGIVPATIFAFCNDKEKQIDALITAGQIGKIISNKVALAGAIMGCQGECGSASAMAAGALAYIKDCSPEEIIEAATLTLKNILGLVCDPVAGLVEVPCVKRNVFMAMNAISGVQLAQAGIKSIIPPDEVIDAMYQIGTFMSPQLKESSEAGLAATKTALKIAENLK